MAMVVKNSEREVEMRESHKKRISKRLQIDPENVKGVFLNCQLVMNLL